MTFMPQFIIDRDHLRLEANLLAELSRDGLAQRLVAIDLAAPESIYQARLDAELKIIDAKGVSGYFLIVADYVQWAKDNGIAVGPGRGSGPCSLTGFALGITNIDPIKYGLPFERFVNPDRDTLPDFDLDFCDARRNEVTRYIQSKYGADRVAQISSDELAPMPSRLVICDRPLAELTSLYLNPSSGFPATKSTLSQVADAGLVQFNVINQKALTLNQRAVQSIAQSGTAINLDTIALDDPATYELLSTGLCSNIEILDSEAYTTALITVQPDRFEALWAVIALCQPRLQCSIPLYIERKRNPRSIRHFHPALESITSETYGLILYQEQVMHIVHKIAGFSYAQGDLLRRAIKTSDDEALATYKKKFIDGGLNFGLSRAEAAGVFEHISVASQSSFNKSHAVAFGKIAYQTAWLKANYQR